MKDPIQRLHDDASGVPGPDPASGKEWLNSAHVVSRIVREFAVEALRIVGQGKPDVMDRLDFECRRMNSLFLGDGQSDAYLKGPWNRPDQLGEFIGRAMKIDGRTDLAVRDAFMVFTDKLLNVAGGTEFGPQDEHRLDVLVADMRDALLGLTGAVKP